MVNTRVSHEVGPAQFHVHVNRHVELHFSAELMGPLLDIDERVVSFSIKLARDKLSDLISENMRYEMVFPNNRHALGTIRRLAGRDGFLRLTLDVEH